MLPWLSYQQRLSEDLRKSSRKLLHISFKVNRAPVNVHRHALINLPVKVILTRFSRVTIHAAHKYLGLTTEVLRTEKAINDIACHPLPSSFYEGGGLQRLRQRFDRQSGEDSPTAPEDYFSPSHSSRESSESIHRLSDEQVVSDSPQAMAHTTSKDSPVFTRAHSSRTQVQAGDLHTTTGSNDTYRYYHRSLSSTGLGIKPDTGISTTLQSVDEHRLPFEDFDLRDEVMSCIAKSIGLHQPPLSGSDSVEASPAFSAARSRSADSRERDRPFTSFSSLSLLETGDDVSSMASSSVLDSNGSIAALDNEVEILYFAAGSTLARAGEKHPGGSCLNRLIKCRNLLITIRRALLCDRWHP